MRDGSTHESVLFLGEPKGALWEDRSHATAMEHGAHLFRCRLMGPIVWAMNFHYAYCLVGQGSKHARLALSHFSPHEPRCLVYIDLNMVRSGVVNHPSEWPFSGYEEIQEPRQRYALVDYEKLQHLLHIELYDQLKDTHRRRVEESLTSRTNGREHKWTESIAVGPALCRRYQSKAWERGRNNFLNQAHRFCSLSSFLAKSLFPTEIIPKKGSKWTPTYPSLTSQKNVLH